MGRCYFFCVGGIDAGYSYISRNFIIPILGLFDQLLELVCPLSNRMGILGILEIPINIIYLLVGMVLTFLSRSIFPNIVFIPGLFYLKVVGFPIFSQDGQTKCLFAEVVEARPLSL